MNTVTVEHIRALCREKQFDEALRAVNALLRTNAFSPFLWNWRGDLIQLTDDYEFELKDAEASYQRALAINPNDLEALESLSHYYDSIDSDPAKAKEYATLYLERTAKSRTALEKLLSE